MVVFIDAFMGMAGSVYADHAAAVLQPGLKRALVGLAEQNAGIIIQNDDVDALEPVVGENRAVAGLGEFPAVFLGQFFEYLGGLGSGFRMVEARGGRRARPELVGAVDPDRGEEGRGETQGQGKNEE